MEFLSDLFDLKLTNGNFSYLSEHIGQCNAAFVASFIRDASMKYGVTIDAGFDLSKIFNDLPQAMDFYRTAEKRNSAILANTITTMKERGQNVAALITGGYHSQGITELLRQNRTSYIVILPKFDVSKGERPYVAILTNKAAPYERLLKSGQYFIAASAYLAGISQLNQNVDNRILAGENLKEVLNSPEFKELKARLADSLIASLLQSVTGAADVNTAVLSFKKRQQVNPSGAGREMKAVVEQYLRDYKMLLEIEGAEFREARVKPLTSEILKELVRDVVLDYAGLDILQEEPVEAKGPGAKEIPAAVAERIQDLSARIGVLEETDRQKKIDAVVVTVKDRIEQEGLDRDKILAEIELEIPRKGLKSLGAAEQQAIADRIIAGLAPQAAVAEKPVVIEAPVAPVTEIAVTSAPITEVPPVPTILSTPVMLDESGMKLALELALSIKEQLNIIEEAMKGVPSEAKNLTPDTTEKLQRIMDAGYKIAELIDQKSQDTTLSPDQRALIVTISRGGRVSPYDLKNGITPLVSGADLILALGKLDKETRKLLERSLERCKGVVSYMAKISRDSGEVFTITTPSGEFRVVQLRDWQKDPPQTEDEWAAKLTIDGLSQADIGIRLKEIAAKPEQAEKISGDLLSGLHKKIDSNTGFIKMALLFALSLYMLILSAIPLMAAPARIPYVAPQIEKI
ncbi:MAG: hypothetical protein ABH875_02190, partial [Candidatus Omnitrophota bacterium]